MAQQLLNLQDVLANQAAWDAALQANISALRGALRTFAMSISFQGSVSSPSVINIQLENSDGTPLAESVYVRVRICNNGVLANSTNATIAVSGATTLAETITSGKDIVVLSNASGLIQIAVTDATAETVTLRIGPSLVSPAFANYNNSQQLVHA